MVKKIIVKNKIFHREEEAEENCEENITIGNVLSVIILILIISFVVFVVRNIEVLRVAQIIFSK